MDASHSLDEHHDHENKCDDHCKVNPRNTEELGRHVMEHCFCNLGYIPGGSSYDLGEGIGSLCHIKPDGSSDHVSVQSTKDDTQKGILDLFAGHFYGET